jgi:hypothetical protein
VPSSIRPIPVRVEAGDDALGTSVEVMGNGAGGAAGRREWALHG